MSDSVGSTFWRYCHGCSHIGIGALPAANSCILSPSQQNDAEEKSRYPCLRVIHGQVVTGRIDLMAKEEVGLETWKYVSNAEP